MTFAYPLPWWAVVLVVAATLALAYRTYAGPAVPLTAGQRRGLTTLRAVTLLLLVVFLTRPMIVERGGGRRDAVVPVLVDVSRSMGIADVDGEARLVQAQEVAADVAAALGAEFQVDRLTFGEQLTDATGEPADASARRTDLAGALRAARERYQGRALAGIVIVSDGGDTSGEDASQAVTPDVPIVAIGVGARRVGRDREVTGLTVERAPLAGSVVELAASVVSRGFGDAPIEVTVRENGRPVQVRRVTPAADGSPARVTFPVSPSPDRATLYTVEIAADPAELVADNNRRSAVVQPPGRRRRLLLVEGSPGFEHSFLKRALAGDPGLEVDAVVRKGQNERGEETFYVQASETRGAALVGGYPATRAALFAYDAVVIANVDGASLSRDELAQTAAFVAERGGGLLVMGARSFEGQPLLRTPLEEVLPVELVDRAGLAVGAGERPAGDRYQPLLTPDGARHAVMQLGDDAAAGWAAAPALASAASVGGPRPGALVLAESVGTGGVVRPLVAVQRYGEGRSMVFTGEAAWRWKMLLPSENRLYETFWRQAVRWLAGGSPDPVALSAPADAMAGDVVPLSLLVRDAEFAPVGDAAVTMTITEPGGLERETHVAAAPGEPGRYATGIRTDEAGLYRVHAEARHGATALGAADAVVLVGGVDQEMADPRQNTEVLRRLAEASGGALVAPDEAGDIASRLAARLADERPPATHDLWHTPWAFLLVVILVGTEWGLRRQWGMR